MINTALTHSHWSKDPECGVPLYSIGAGSNNLSGSDCHIDLLCLTEAWLGCERSDRSLKTFEFLLVGNTGVFLIAL